MSPDLVQWAQIVGTTVGAAVGAGLTASRAVRGKLGPLVQQVLEEERPKWLESLRGELRATVREHVLEETAEHREELAEHRREVSRLRGSVDALFAFLRLSPPPSPTEASPPHPVKDAAR